MQLIILGNRHFKCGMDCSVTVEKNCCNACPCRSRKVAIVLPQDAYEIVVQISLPCPCSTVNVKQSFPIFWQSRIAQKESFANSFNYSVSSV